MADDEEELGVIGSGYGYGFTPNHEYRKEFRATLKLAYAINNPALMWMKIHDYLMKSCILEVGPDGEEITVADVIIMPEMADFFLETAAAIVNLANGTRSAGEIMDYPEKYEDRVPDPVRPKEAITLLPQALNFTRRGYNAFAQLASIRQKIHEARLYDLLIEDGLSSREALDALSRELGEMAHSRRRRRIREGQFFKKHIWSITDDATFHHLCWRMKIGESKDQ